jgi:hypothetical protein
VRTFKALAMLVLVSAVAGAANLSINGVNRAEFWAYFDSVWSTQAEDMLDLNIRYGDLRGEAGLFLYEPSHPWDDTRKPMRLFDYSIAYSPKQLEVLYGKFYQAFGKGLALRAYKDDDFRHYKSLHGLRGTAHLPLQTDVVLLGARLRDIFFQENTYKLMNVGDTTDQVLGADLKSRPIKWFGFGGRYVRINRKQDPTPKAFTELYGGDLTAAIGPFELYGEVCQRLGTKAGVGGREKGFGYYTSATAAFPGFSVLGQYMDYDSIGFPPGIYHYNDPPTPIKSGVALDRGVNEQGFGAAVTATPWGPLYIEGDFGRLYRHDDTSAGVLEWEGKARYNPVAEWTFEIYFNHMLQHNVEAGTYERVVDKPVVHVNHVLGQHSFALEGEVGLVNEQSTDGDSWDYLETALAVSYGYGEALLFTAGWQYVSVELEKRYNGETSWPMFEAVWSITHRNMLRVRVGAERGGYTCSGGVCRFEAPFKGIKAQLISRF